jgi:endonuclease/exonuclease/phosphatase family metal-dependent hydrolase
MPKIATLNIQQYDTRHGPWAARRELIVAALRSARPDVVALHAVRRDPQLEGGVDQAAQIAGMLQDYAVVFEPATELGRGALEGSALLARTDLFDVEARHLELGDASEDATRRLVLKARVETRRTSIDVFCCHFSWVAEKNQRNAEEAAAWISTFRGPRVLLGDMNAPPEARSFTRFAELGFLDLWPALRPRDVGHTFEQGRLFTRVDYAWVSTELAHRTRSIEVLADGEAPGGVRASDHLGLIVDIDA